MGTDDEAPVVTGDICDHDKFTYSSGTVCVGIPEGTGAKACVTPPEGGWHCGQTNWWLSSSDSRPMQVGCLQLRHTQHFHKRPWPALLQILHFSVRVELKTSWDCRLPTDARERLGIFTCRRS